MSLADGICYSQQDDQEEIWVELADLVPGDGVDQSENGKRHKGNRILSLFLVDSGRSNAPAAEVQRPIIRLAPEQTDIRCYLVFFHMQFLPHEFRQIGGGGNLYTYIHEYGDHTHPDLRISKRLREPSGRHLFITYMIRY